MKRKPVPPRFEAFKGRNGLWYWRLVAGNGEVVAQSEAYASRRNAIRAVNDVRVAVVHAVEDPRREPTGDRPQTCVRR